ncbi:hypothetical protein LCGC14_0862500 [marine sediment metagenome]|uniref:Uncharacterized protein n=1 Tax=marine sediment metagenome TaxID=412755 RepID=A0A0F9RRN6_9ZZZZ
MNLNNDIIKLNEAYRKIIEGITTIKTIYSEERSLTPFIIKFQRVHGELNRKVLELLKEEQPIIIIKKGDQDGK